ncbi:unnamed protein product [Brachionus calyciflorus]|uniref:CWH43-like N-terminal domain-containing protein n=1 Tax=Brachionus calyciflorus TaxID=104777 RepID=A0A813YJC4_9BILA|nr:unnamed protein product [Brachionus calyciflorus]
MNIELIAKCSAIFPLTALAYCYIYPILIDFNQITKTHCNTKNFLPSVSAAISYSPMTSIFWFLLILIHTPFRFMLAKCLNETYKKLFARKYTSMYLASSGHYEYKKYLKLRKNIYFAYQINKIEIIGLFILSTFTSNANYEMHKLGFITYLICASIFKILICSIEYRLMTENMPNCFHERKKLALIFANSFFLAIIFFMVHNAECMDFGNYFI